jgi:hypothetical protein
MRAYLRASESIGYVEINLVIFPTHFRKLFVLNLPKNVLPNFHSFGSHDNRSLRTKCQLYKPTGYSMATLPPNKGHQVPAWRRGKVHQCSMHPSPLSSNQGDPKLLSLPLMVVHNVWLPVLLCDVKWFSPASVVNASVIKLVFSMQLQTQVEDGITEQDGAISKQAE